MTSIDDIKAMADRSIAESMEARRIADQRRRRHRLKIRFLFLLAVAGMALIASQIVAENPYLPLLFLGVVMVVPVIVEWSEG